MEAELRIRLPKELKTTILANAKASGLNYSSYARIVFANVGVVTVNKSNSKVPPQISLIEKVIKKANG